MNREFSQKNLGLSIDTSVIGKYYVRVFPPAKIVLVNE